MNSLGNEGRQIGFSLYYVSFLTPTDPIEMASLWSDTPDTLIHNKGTKHAMGKGNNYIIQGKKYQTAQLEDTLTVEMQVVKI